MYVAHGGRYRIHANLCEELSFEDMTHVRFSQFRDIAVKSVLSKNTILKLIRRGISRRLDSSSSLMVERLPFTRITKHFFVPITFFGDDTFGSVALTARVVEYSDMFCIYSSNIV